MRGLGFKVALWICCGGFSILGVDVFAQVNNYINFTVDDGLPSNEVYHVIEDEQGYIWFATDKGVSRFNGYEFENFTTTDGLHNNVIFQLYEDTVANRIWCTGLGNALSFFDLKTTQIRVVAFAEDILSDRQTDKYIFKIEQDTVVLNYRYNVSTYHYDGSDQLRLIKELEVRSEYKVTYRYPFFRKYSRGNKVNQLKVLNGYLCRYQYMDTTYNVHYLNQGFSKDRGMATKLNNGVFLFHEVGSIYFIDSLGHIEKENNIENGLGVYVDSLRGVYVVREDGATLIQMDTSGSVLISPIPALENKFVTSCTWTQEQSFWATTRDQGVFYAKSDYINKRTEADGLVKNAVRAFYPDQINQCLWVSYYGSGSLTKVLKDWSFKNKSVTQLEIEYLHPVGPDTLLVSSGNSTYVYTLRSNKKHRLPYEGMAQFYNTASSDIWLHRKAKAGTLVNGVIDQSTRKGSYRVGISTDEQMVRFRDTIWSGGLFGLGYLDSEEKWHTYRKDMFGRVKGIAHHQDEFLAIASLGKGLFVRVDNSILQITEADGLISNLCNGVYVDNKQGIWVYSNKGVSHVTFTDSSYLGYNIFNYTPQDGLLSAQVNDVIRVDSSVWFATPKGINTVDLRYEQLDKKNCSTEILGIQVDETALATSQEASIDYNANLEFEYISVDIKKLGNIIYEYRMLGLDPVWRKTQSRSVRFPKLEDGDYTFEVRVFDPSARMTPRSATFSFSVIAPFWKTWWFLLFCGFLIAAVIRFRFAQLREKSKLKTELLDVRRQALAAQMNPHFLFNSFNSIRNFVLQNDKEKADEYIVRFSELTRGILNNSFKESISLQQELDMIANYLDIERMRVHNKFDYDIAISPDVEADTIEIPPAVLHPFVENAVWHGVKELTDRQGKIDIRCFLEGAYLICQIQDNGKGFEKSPKKDPRKRKSFGIDITKQRLELVQTAYHQQVQVDVSTIKKNGVVAGVLVTLKFKLSHGK